MRTSENAASGVTACAGAVIVDTAGRLLCVLRKREPHTGCWSIPGGRIEPGESAVEAARREVLEETGLRVRVGSELGIVEMRYADADGHERVLEIHDFAAAVESGNLAPGDDAADARWFTRRELQEQQLTPGLLAALEGFGVELR